MSSVVPQSNTSFILILFFMIGSMLALSIYCHIDHNKQIQETQQYEK